VELVAVVGCGIKATSDVFFDDGALYDVVTVPPPTLSLTGEDVAEVFALRVLNSNRGCGFEVLGPDTGEGGVIPGDCRAREYPVALPSSEGRLEDGAGVDGLGAVEEGGSAAFPEEIVARLG
jgi:hypothetical protein